MKELVRLNKRPSSDGSSFSYVLRYTDEFGKRKWETLGHSDRRRAEKQQAQKEKELQMGYFEPTSMRLMDFMKDSIERTGDQIRESTKDEYESAMKDFISKIGNMDFQRVTIEAGEKYRQACLDDGNVPATVAKKLKHLKRFFQLAVNRKQLDENPLKHIDMPKVRKKKVRIYSDAECQRILKAAHQFCQGLNLEYCPQWDLMIIVALTTGMRRAELLNCTWSDIDFEEQVINITPKEKEKHTWRWDIKDTDERTLPLIDEAAQLLADHQAKQPEGYPYVFVPAARYDYIQTLRAKGRWKYSDARLKVVNNFTRQFEKILKIANVKKGQFHDLRRTAITHWFANSMNENDVMVLAGHSNFATTHEFYLAVADDLVDRARRASAQSPASNFGAFWCRNIMEKKGNKIDNYNILSIKEL